MAGNHPSELSPRQRMINMMYLVLTALLALNVSKEVLDSFFEVNKGIERTTTNFFSKNVETYSAFDNAAENNPEKYKDVRDQAYEIKKMSDELVMLIQEMKYDLVLKTDKRRVYLGEDWEILDPENGKPIKSKAIEDKKFEELTLVQKKKKIGWLENKSDRTTSGDLFWPKGWDGTIKPENRAKKLKDEIIKFSTFLIMVSGENKQLIKSIESSTDVSDRKKKKKTKSWEEYYFYDMPAVGALTLLSKIQSDVRNAEADVIDFLKKDIDAKSLKFTSAEGIAVPKSNFILRGDSFRAEIFITAKNPSQNPDIYVGEYDSVGGGEYQMVGEYETVKVVNGKGMFASRTTSEGVKKWGGLITMKTETGTKYYPFGGEYLVASKSVVVSPVNMNVFYLQVDNPVKISVPGFAAADVSASMTNGKIRATKKTTGEWIARPNKKGKSIVTLYAIKDNKKTKMGQMDFRVKEVPPPIPIIDGKSDGVISRERMRNFGGIEAKLEEFDFKGIKYKVISFTMTGTYKGDQQTLPSTRAPQFDSKMITMINNTKSGNSITFANIKARRTDAKGTSIRSIPSLVLTIK